MVSTAQQPRTKAPVYPVFRPSEEWDREYLLDVANAAAHDSWSLVGNRDLVEAICRDYVELAAQRVLDTERIPLAAMRTTQGQIAIYARGAP